MNGSKNSGTFRHKRKSLSEPEGPRKKLAESFLADLHPSWEQHRREMLDRLNTEQPEVYLRLMTKLAVYAAELD